jgi:hypothetical protein
MPTEFDRLFGTERIFNKQREGPAEVKFDPDQVRRLALLQDWERKVLSIDLGIPNLSVRDRRSASVLAFSENDPKMLNIINSPAWFTHLRVGKDSLFLLDQLRKENESLPAAFLLGSEGVPQGWKAAWSAGGKILVAKRRS